MLSRVQPVQFEGRRPAYRQIRLVMEDAAREFGVYLFPDYRHSRALFQDYRMRVAPLRQLAGFQLRRSRRRSLLARQSVDSVHSRRVCVAAHDPTARPGRVQLRQSELMVRLRRERARVWPQSSARNDDPFRCLFQGD